jgi:predicted phage-related endonuclease
LAALVGGQKFVMLRVERDEELIQQMIESATEFWYSSVESRIEPPVTERDTELLNKIYSNSDPSKVVEFESNDDAVLVRDLILTKEKLGIAKASHELAVNQIKDQMREAEQLIFQGQKVATWKADKNGKRTFKIV